MKRFAFLIGFLFLVCFWDVLAGFRTFYFRDFSLFGDPIAAHLRERFWMGELPLWNPNNNCGLPFLAQWNTLALYPGSLLYELLPVPWSVNLFCIAHLILGGFGMRRLVSTWTTDRFSADFAGLLFAFNGFSLNCLMWPNNAAAWGWMPWVVIALNRRLACAALTGAMQLLTGAPEIIFFTWLIGGVLALVNYSAPAPNTGPLSPGERARVRAPLRIRLFDIARNAFFVAAASALALALAAPQLLPFLELAKQSQRGGDFLTAAWAMPATGLAQFFVPLFGSSPTSQGPWLQDGQGWTSSYFIGVLTLPLAVFGARGRLGFGLAAVAVASLIMAHGLFSFPLFRFPIKWVAPALFCLITLAAIGLGKVKIKPLLWAAVIAQLIILALAIASPKPALPQNALIQSVFLWLGLALLWKRLELALLVATALGIAAHAPWQNPTVPAAALARSTEPSTGRKFLTLEAYEALREKMLSDASTDLLIRRAAQFQNLNLIDGNPKLDGFFSLYPKREHDFRHRLYTSELADVGPALDFLGVHEIATPGAIAEWTPRTSSLPLATAGQTPIVAEAGRILDALLKPDFKPLQTVFLESPSFVARAQTNATVRLAHFSPQRLDLEISGAPCLVVIAQTFDPNWRAEANGTPLRVLRANHNFIAIEVSAGATSVILKYRSRSFAVGLAIAAGAMAACVFLIKREASARQQIQNLP